MSESKKDNRVHNAIMAWHASPYDFDKFGPMRQVSGKGQGAAMFGRGVAYLAESKEVSGPGKSKYMEEFASHPAVSKSHASSLDERTPFSYHVAVHLTPETLLDWDEPLARHDQEARRKIYEAHQLPQDGTGSLPVDDSDKGGTHYKALIARHGSDYAASEALYDAGIHGIRYADGASRGLPRYLVDFKDPKGRSLAIENKDSFDEHEIEAISAVKRAFNKGHHSALDGGIIELQDRIDYIRDNVRYRGFEPSQKEIDKYYKAQDWLRDNHQHFHKVPNPKFTYNYVVFHPDLLEILAKYDIRGNLVKEYTPGAHLKSVDHDPFEDEHK